jgi:hypothetical protein
MPTTLPYVTSPGNIRRVLEKIQEAATPSRFTHDFLETKLGLSGGGARPLVPFLKRVGALAPDGTPTDLYKRFRNPAEAGAAAAEMLKIGYSDLYEVNEYAHDLSDAKLRGLFVQVTGNEETSQAIRFLLGSFKALKEFANFDELAATQQKIEEPFTQPPAPHPPAPDQSPSGVGLNLSYTINLNLPATDDIAVFNAIFKSLKENILKGQ